MLILTRKVNESIMIDKDIKIKVLDIQGGQVRIGIDAPKFMSIYREEIYSKIQNTLEKIQQKVDHG